MDPTKMSQAELAQLPAAAPPLGVTPNFVDPESCGNAVIVVLTVFSALTTLVVVLRMYTRMCISKSVGWDDCGSL